MAIQKAEVFYLLDKAATKGLVAVEDGRYRMSESLRDYCREIDSEEGQVRSRNAHFAYYTSFVEDTELKVRGPDQRHWLHVFHQERENLRVALEWGFSRPELYEASCEALYNLTPFDFIRAAFSEAIWQYGNALERADRLEPCLRSRLLRRAGLMASYRLDPRAKEWLTQAVEYAKACGDEPVIADSVYTLGRYLILCNDIEGAVPRLNMALEKFRKLGDIYGEGFALVTLAGLEAFAGNEDVARDLYEQSLRVRTESGDLRGVGASLCLLASLELRASRVEATRKLVLEGLSLFAELGTEFDFVDAVPRAAWVLATMGHPSEGAELLAYSERASQGSLRDPTDAEDLRRALVLVQSLLTESEFEEASAKGSDLDMQAAFDLVKRLLDEGSASQNTMAADMRPN